MEQDWDKIADNLLIYEQTNNSKLRDWGHVRPINVYENLIGRNIRSDKKKTAFISFEGEKSFKYSYEEVDSKTKQIVYLLQNYVSAKDRILIIGPPCAATTFTILSSSFLGCEHTVVMPSLSEEATNKINNLFRPSVIVMCNIAEERNHGKIPVIKLESMAECSWLMETVLVKLQIIDHILINTKITCFHYLHPAQPEHPNK